MSVTREGRPECWSWGRGLYWISSRELTRELESGDEAGKARSRVLRVPITGDLPSVLDGDYGVENRWSLLGEAPSPSSPARACGWVAAWSPPDPSAAGTLASLDHTW